MRSVWSIIKSCTEFPEKLLSLIWLNSSKSYNRTAVAGSFRRHRARTLPSKRYDRQFWLLPLLLILFTAAELPDRMSTEGFVFYVRENTFKTYYELISLAVMMTSLYSDYSPRSPGMRNEWMSMYYQLFHNSYSGTFTSHSFFLEKYCSREMIFSEKCGWLLEKYIYTLIRKTCFAATGLATYLLLRVVQTRC